MDRVLLLAGLVCVSSLAYSLLTPPVLAAPGGALEADFTEWAKAEKKYGYQELARRFLVAGGRDAAAYEKRVAELTTGFREYLSEKKPATPKERVAALREYLFKKQGFEADLDLEKVDNLFPDSILDRKRGYCLGLSLLVLDMGERLGWPLVAASAPRHTFVRYLGTPPINLETTLKGATHDDAWYQRRFSLGGSKGLLRNLSPRETAAHLVNNHGFALLQSGSLKDAGGEFDKALQLSPDVAEALINQGVLEARCGRYEPALRHFESAAKLWPRDPLVRLNKVNAKLQVGPARAVVKEAVDLLGAHPHLQGVERMGELVLEALDPRSHWQEVQSLSTALNARNVVVAGKRPGLAGSYFRDKNLRALQFERVDRDISFRWSWNSPGKGMPRDNFSARWQGWFQADEKDTYTFYVTCSDGVRIWIDGRQILNAWSRSNDNFTRASIDLTPGLHDLRIEYFESVGEAGISMLLTAEKKKKALDFSSLVFHSPPQK